MAYLYNDATLNLTTGTQTPNASATAGPYSGSAVAESGFCVGVAVTIRPTLSPMNANGKVYMSYYQSDPLTAAARVTSFVDLASSM
jgi:hypothetical protein